MNKKIFFLIIVQFSICKKCVDAVSVIERYNDGCNLSRDLIIEIESYKNVTHRIVKEITNADIGSSMYERRSAGRLSRHAALNDVIRRALVTVNVPAQLEPNGIVRDDGKRPGGVTLIPWKNGRCLVWDATCVDTMAPSHIKISCRAAGVAATDTEIRKLQKYIEFIDKFGARVSGSDTLEKAIDHMINLTYDYQVTDVTTEEVAVPHWVRGHESVTMLEPRRKNIAVLGLVPNVPTPFGGITAKVLVVRSFAELDHIHSDIVKGKIVLFNVPFTTYGETVIYRSLGAIKAAQKGAVASLIRSITPYSLYTPHTGSQRYDDHVTKIPSGAITLEDADLLDRLQKQGETIILKIEMFSTIEEKVSRNTIIDLKGSTQPENVVIVSGHIDSWDVGQGAMDDGGGMMISWFVPVVLTRLALNPKRTVRSILWTAEEPGLIGAAAYLERHKDELNNINLIMESDEGTFKPLGLDVAGSKSARCLIAEILKLFKPIDTMKESTYVGSDISLFIKKGVPGVSLLNDNSRYFWFHHSEADTLNVQNKEDVINCAAFWAAFTYVVADLSVDIPRS